MARIRSVHPGFFTDEAVLQLTVECPIAILLALGLWCESDDAGAFKWLPLTLKARYLGATSVNVNELLERLSALNIVRRIRHRGASDRRGAQFLPLPTAAEARLSFAVHAEVARLCRFRRRNQARQRGG